MTRARDPRERSTVPIVMIRPSSGLEEMRARRVGDPMDPATTTGPTATEGGRADVAELADGALPHGAEALRTAGSRDSGHRRELAASGIGEFLQSDDGLEGLRGRGRAMERDSS